MSPVSCIIDHTINQLDEISFVDNLSLNGKPTVYLEDAIKILIETKHLLKEIIENA